MIYCKALDKEFADKAHMFAALKENKNELISIKKAAIKTTDECSLHVVSKQVIKASEDAGSLEFGDVVLNVINTTNYLDSHDDVHLFNIWDKSVPEQNGKTYHAVDHELKMGMIVGYPNEVVMRLQAFSWRDLGKNYDGITMALLGETVMTDKTNVDVFKAYRDGMPVQHSIRMQYVNIKLALNDPDSKEEFATWSLVYPTIANKDKADAQGYFFAVSEAKIHKEFSTLLFGSNDVTPSLGRKDAPLEEPHKSTPKEPVIDFVAMCSQFKL